METNCIDRLTEPYRRKSEGRALIAKAIWALALVICLISKPAFSQTNRALSFAQLDELPNGQVAHDAGIIAPGEVKSVSVSVPSPLQPVMVQLVSLTEGVTLELTLSNSSDLQSTLKATTDETKTALRTVSGEGTLKINWTTTSEAGGYILSVFLRDALPVSQPIFTRPMDSFDPGADLAALNQPEPGTLRKLLDVLTGNDTTRPKRSSRPVAPDEPVARDANGICSIAKRNADGTTTEDIAAGLENARADAAEKNQDHLNQLATKTFVDILQQVIGDIAPKLVEAAFPKGTGAVNQTVSGSARNFVTNSVKLSAKTGFEAVKAFVLIQEADSKCLKPLGFRMPRLPISHSQNAGFCRSCYDAAYTKIEGAINELARVNCVYGLGKEIRDQARVAMNSAGSGSVLTMPMALLEINKMNKQFDEVVYLPAQKRHAEEIAKLEAGLIELSRCEANMVGFDGWYERFGFSFQANMSAAYQIKHD